MFPARMVWRAPRIDRLGGKSHETDRVLERAKVDILADLLGPPACSPRMRRPFQAPERQRRQRHSTSSSALARQAACAGRGRAGEPFGWCCSPRTSRVSGATAAMRSINPSSNCSQNALEATPPAMRAVDAKAGPVPVRRAQQRRPVTPKSPCSAAGPRAPASGKSRARRNPRDRSGACGHSRLRNATSWGR